MNTSNKIPTSHIVAETKINPQSMEDAVKGTCGIDNWNEHWLAHNLNEKLSDIEKIPESVSRISRKYEVETSTKDFNKVMDKFLSKHMSVSIVFQDVSREFAIDLAGMNCDIHMDISDIKEDEISFWVNPLWFEDHQSYAALFYGKELTRTCEVIDNMVSHIKETIKADEVKAKESANLLKPIISQCNIFSTANVYNWRRVLLEGTKFERKDEMRMVLLDLARRMKMKYYSVFSDIVMENSKGQEFGLDTLRSADNAWREYRLICSQGGS